MAIEELESRGAVDYKSMLLDVVSKASKADSVEDTCKFFEQFIAQLGGQLLSVKFYDTQSSKPPIRPFSAYPESFKNFAIKMDNAQGCPINREAQIKLRPFSLTSIDQTKYPDLQDKIFFREINRLGHQDIAVLPVIIGRGVSLITVGLFDNHFKGKLRTSITDAALHIVATVASRFPEISKLFENKLLTATERKILSYHCEGMGFQEVGEIMDLKPESIKYFIKSASEKLSAKTLAQTVYRAVALGELGNLEVPQPPS